MRWYTSGDPGHYELPKKGTSIHLYRRGAKRPFRARVRDGKGFEAKALK